MSQTMNRLQQIEEKIDTPEFKENTGSANEVSYFIFDYDPKDELMVRDYVHDLVERVNQKTYLDYHISCFDLYDIMINYLKEEDILEDVFEMEEEGFEEVALSICDAMGINTMDENYFIDYIKERIDKNSVIFITGVGKIYPIVRAHKILNNLHLAIDNISVVLFLPGTYSAQNISLFGLLNDNYYRAFKLIEGE